MENADEQTLPGHLNDQERRAESHCAYVQIYVANDDDDRDNNKAEDEVPVEVIELLAEISGCEAKTLRLLTLHLEAPRGRHAEFFFASWYVRIHKEKTVTTPKTPVVTASTVQQSQLPVQTAQRTLQLTICQLKASAVPQTKVQDDWQCATGEQEDAPCDDDACLVVLETV